MLDRRPGLLFADRLAARACQHQHLHAVGRLVENGLPVLQLREAVKRLQRQLLSCANGLVAGELEIVALEVFDKVVDVLGRAQLFAQQGHLLGFGLDGDLLQAVDAPLFEQGGLVFVVLLDLFGRWLWRGLAHFVEVGAGDDVALGSFELLHHARVAVDLEVVGFLQRQLLVDQPLEDLLADGIGLLGFEPALLLQDKVDLVDGDL